MDRNIRRMTRLIDDLLDVSRISHGHIELRKEPVDIVAIVKDVAEEFQPLADDAGNKVTTRLPAQPLYVEADPIRITQIVENLLHNAIKYTDGGKVDIAVAQADGQAVMRMRDSGIGIAAEDLPRIWRPFTQVDTSLERRRSGLGIGLTLVRTLVELHGGAITATSAGPGKGSEFVLKLPLAGRAATAKGESRAGAEPSALSGRRILVVDDNIDAAESFASLLRLMDNDVRTAPDGPTALRVAREYRPELVLLDIGLPGMNGYDVARELRRELGNGRMLIVAVTGYGAPEDRHRSAEAGFDAHFVKPIEIGDLQALVASRKTD
jgi:CheY-like chemotaxis protein/two-component sensor histidine kinase